MIGSNTMGIPERPAWRSGSWWICVLVLTCQVFIPLAGTPVAALFAAVILLFVAAYPGSSLRAMARDPTPWLYPAVALASVAWSDARGVSLRLALELLLTTGGMVALGSRLATRNIISALMLALLLAACASLLVTPPASLAHADAAVIGIFASKNLLAFHMVLLVLSAAAVLLDPDQPRLLRMAAAGGMLLGPVLVLAARSAGATLMGFAAIVIFAAVVLIGATPRRLHGRILAAAALVLVGLAGFVAVAGPEVMDGILEATGKNATLTGRTYLWSRASDLIGERPLLGYGYQAFWRQEYAEAEALWRTFKIANRTGFHFHDLYYEVGIELGVLGLAAMIVTLLVYIGRSATAAVRRPAPQTGFLLSLCMLIVMRTGIEVDLGYPFGIAAALLPILLTRPQPAAARSIPMQHTAGSFASGYRSPVRQG